MTNHNPIHNPTPRPEPPATPRPFTMTYEQRLAIEDQLVEAFSEVIDLDAADTSAAWHGPTSQLMEMAWALSRLHRIIDHDTRRPMTMRRLARLLCRNLHRRLPANIYSVARQSRQARRPSVIDRFGRLWYEEGVAPRELLAAGARQPESHTHYQQPPSPRQP